MYSTPKKRLFELKKELMQLKRKMDKKAKIAEKKGEIPESFAHKYEYGNWGYYEIITSDGTKYNINQDTRYFPNIDFKKIVYIDKGTVVYWGKNGNVLGYRSYDSFTGFHQIWDIEEYLKYIDNKFKVKDSIYRKED